MMTRLDKCRDCTRYDRCGWSNGPDDWCGRYRSRYENFIVWACVLVVLAGLLLMLLAGCTTITYDRQTGRVVYQRVGYTEIGKLEIVRDSNDVLVNLENYKGENIGEIAGKIAEGAVRGAK